MLYNIFGLRILLSESIIAAVGQFIAGVKFVSYNLTLTKHGVKNMPHMMYDNSQIGRIA